MLDNKTDQNYNPNNPKLRRDLLQPVFFVLITLKATLN